MNIKEYILLPRNIYEGFTTKCSKAADDVQDKDKLNQDKKDGVIDMSEGALPSEVISAGASDQPIMMQKPADKSGACKSKKESGVVKRLKKKKTGKTRKLIKYNWISFNK